MRLTLDLLRVQTWAVLSFALAIISFGCGLWLCYMIRYPKRWNAHIDRMHSRLRAFGLSVSWMQAMEKVLPSRFWSPY
jgi:hypothetical protein